MSNQIERIDEPWPPTVAEIEAAIVQLRSHGELNRPLLGTLRMWHLRAKAFEKFDVTGKRGTCG